MSLFSSKSLPLDCELGKTLEWRHSNGDITKRGGSNVAEISPASLASRQRSKVHYADNGNGTSTRYELELLHRKLRGSGTGRIIIILSWYSLILYFRCQSSRLSGEELHISRTAGIVTCIIYIQHCHGHVSVKAMDILRERGRCARIMRIYMNTWPVFFWWIRSSEWCEV